MYFKNIDNVLYDFTIQTDTSEKLDIVQDLTTRVSVYSDPKDFLALTDDYIITHGEMPEMISDKLYETPEYHWTILYINEIINLSEDWPMTEAQLATYCQEKYGATIDDVKHTIKIPESFVMDRTFIIGEYGADYAVDVTNWEYESDLNDRKRFIKVIKPTFISQFVDMFMKSMTV